MVILLAVQIARKNSMSRAYRIDNPVRDVEVLRNATLHFTARPTKKKKKNHTAALGIHLSVLCGLRKQCGQAGISTGTAISIEFIVVSKSTYRIVI